VLPWPTEALTEVAFKFFKEGNLEDEYVDRLATIVGQAHGSVEKASKRMLDEQKRINYVTPTNYIELVTGYMSMLQEKNQNRQQVGG
jgi:dynein heavy chain